MNKSNIMKQAWAIAKGTVKTLAEKALEKGNRWTKGSYDRVYFNWSDMGLKIRRYNTGNIAEAWFNGEKISNAMAGRMMTCKVWFDLATEKFSVKKNYFKDFSEEKVLEIAMAYVNA